MGEQTIMGVPNENWPVRILFASEAYELYDVYAKTHVATKADPLRTFSGWLHDTGAQLIDGVEPC